MTNLKCPVCGKPGIPNYHKEDVVCPNCGSDLRIYQTISNVTDEHVAINKKIQKYKYLTITLPILSIILILIPSFFYVGNMQKNFDVELSKKEKCITALQDSIANLASLKATIDIVEYEVYTVVRNDGPWTIVNKIFGNTKNWAEDYKKIAKDNDLWDEQKGTWKMIHPEQKLKIYKSK